MSLYNLKSADGGFRITKFDADLNPDSSYLVSSTVCECPQWQGRQKACRHMRMLPLFIAAKHVDDGAFLEFNTSQWHEFKPITEKEIYGEGSDEQIDVDHVVTPVAATAGPSTYQGTGNVELAKSSQGFKTFTDTIKDGDVVDTSLGQMAYHVPSTFKRRV